MLGLGLGLGLRLLPSSHSANFSDSYHPYQRRMASSPPTPSLSSLVTSALTQIHACECASSEKDAADKIHTLARSLEDIANTATGEDEGQGAVRVPSDAVRAVDMGWSPEAFAIRAVEAATNSEQAARGPLRGMQKYRRDLRDEGADMVEQ